jgi:hypothetical protein
MSDYSDSTDRRPGDYLRFAVAFISFVMAGGGLIVSSPGGAIAGATLLLLAVLSFLPRRPTED